MKQERMTQQYTTCWSDLGLVRAIGFVADFRMLYGAMLPIPLFEKEMLRPTESAWNFGAKPCRRSFAGTALVAPIASLAYPVGQ
jgi:hypothetical protein